MILLIFLGEIKKTKEFSKFEISNFCKMKTPILIDTRGIVDPNDAHKSKLIFRGLGRG